MNHEVTVGVQPRRGAAIALLAKKDVL